MFHELKDALQFVEEHDIRMIDLKFADLFGRWHRVTISAKEFNEELMEQGVGFDGSSVGLKKCRIRRYGTDPRSIHWFCGPIF